MADNSAALSQAPQTSEPSPRSIDQSSQPPPQSSGLSQESAGHTEGWEIIGEQQDFYGEQDCLYLNHNLASTKLGARKEDDVVIFDYSLDPGYLKRADGNPPVEEGAASSGRPSVDDDVFLLVPKSELEKSKQFDQMINPPKEPPQSLSRGPRLGVIDFPQCYDTHDASLLNSMAEKLGLPKEHEATFMGAHLKRVRALPGQERFRTGVSLRAPFRDPSKLPKPGSSEDRFILFVSFPYFGISREKITLDRQRESLKLVDFRLLGVDVHDRRVEVGWEGGAEKGEILVHQARYMIFDNYIMASFRSKEDSVRNQIPLHRFQERVGAFRAMIHMIANRTELELRILGKLQASLHKLEEDIDRVISDTKVYEDDERMKRKQERVRDVLVAFNRLSADFFAAISVAERQIIVLQDVHSVFLTSYRTKTKAYEKGYPLRRNPFHKSAALIPILLENPEQIWPNTLDTIDEVVRERKCFIKKVKGLVENMDIRRKILSAFLKSDQAKAAPSEKTAQETTGAMKRTEDAVKATTDAIASTERAIGATTAAIARTEGIIAKTQAEIIQQGQTLTSFTIVTTAFLPLGFCTSYFGMNNIKEFDGPSNLRSLLSFWLATGPTLAGVLLLTVVVILWKRKRAEELRSWAWGKLGWSGRSASHPGVGSTPRRGTDIENVAPAAPDSQAPHGSLSSMSYHPPPTPLPSGSEQGESILLAPVSSPRPPPQQQSPSGAYPTSPMSTSNPNRASLPLSSAGQLSTSLLLPNSGRSDTMPHS